MNKIFNDVAVAGILAPGQAYVLSECPSNCPALEPIYELFVISREAELLIALDLIFDRMFAEDYELVKFLGIRKINEDCHQFKILCRDRRFESNDEHTMYLSRIRSFEEFVHEVERDY